MSFVDIYNAVYFNYFLCFFKGTGFIHFNDKMRENLYNFNYNTDTNREREREKTLCCYFNFNVKLELQEARMVIPELPI